MGSTPIPTPSLVVLIGPPASGKSTWAAEQFRADQIVCADTLRGVVGEHELDLSATDDAFDLLDRIVDARLGRGLTTVIDTTGLDETRRRTYLDVAQRHGASAVAVRFATPAAECKRRNRERAHPVPPKAIDTMARTARDLDLSGEDWDLVIEPQPVRTVTRRLSDVVAEPTPDPSDPPARSGLRMGLLVSDFSWADEASDIGPTLARIATDAERVGFHSVWVMDHLVQIPQVGRRWDPMLDAWGALTYCAAATARIRLGTLVSPVTFRHVVLVAKAVATLDVLSGGRAIAGLGAGSSAHEHRALGLPFGSAEERLAMLDDAAQALRMLLGPGGASFDGGALHIPDTSLYPRPIQEHLPIIIGGSGERVTLRIAAQHGDGCNLFGDVDTVRRRIEWLHHHCTDVGRDPAEVEVTHLGSMLLAADSDDLRMRVDALRRPDVGPDRYAEQANAGTVDDHEFALRRLAEVGVDHAIVSVPDVARPGALDPFVALTERLR
ncbi:MAG: TIGR03619 family F420-dependent LLM class oxidoreductase [Actinomycetota bacterium]